MAESLEFRCTSCGKLLLEAEHEGDGHAIVRKKCERCGRMNEFRVPPLATTYRTTVVRQSIHTKGIVIRHLA